MSRTQHKYTLAGNGSTHFNPCTSKPARISHALAGKWQHPPPSGPCQKRSNSIKATSWATNLHQGHPPSSPTIHHWAAHHQQRHIMAAPTFMWATHFDHPPMGFPHHLPLQGPHHAPPTLIFQWASLTTHAWATHLHQSHKRPKRLLLSHVQQQHRSNEAHTLHITNLHVGGRKNPERLLQASVQKSDGRATQQE
eukprot:373485-Pelagomonas_calceolata.AAC.2